MSHVKKDVQDFWSEASCGESLYLDGLTAGAYQAQASERYRLEPYILDFAGFGQFEGRNVLEIGVGLGADHERFVRAGARIVGVDLTERAVRHTSARLASMGLGSRLTVGDAENLCLPDSSFDLVYSWGVLHHSPDTPKAINEVWRVLKPGGEARIMIYSKWSLVGLMLWMRYGLMRLRPWTSLETIYSRFLESPGTKAYTRSEAKQLFSNFADVQIETVLTHGDLLESGAGQRHRGGVLALARRVWPRWLFRAVTPRMGLFMMIHARK